MGMGMDMDVDTSASVLVACAEEEAIVPVPLRFVTIHSCVQSTHQHINQSIEPAHLVPLRFVN